MTNWKPLYRLGSAAAMLAVIVFRRNFAAEMIAFKGFGIFSVPEAIPVRALEWFELFQRDPFVGLALSGVIDVIDYALVALMFLALYGALRQVSRGVMVLTTSLSLAGAVIFIVSNQSLALLSLSDLHAAAQTEAQRTMFLAAGEALLAINNPGVIPQGSGAYTGLFLLLVAGLIASVIMLRSNVFSRATAVTGLLANGVALSFFITLFFVPALAWLPIPISAPFRLIWYILIARRLLQLESPGAVQAPLPTAGSG